MNKEEAVKWMTESKLAENEFSAGHIWEGLKLWEHEEETQKELVKTYRKWRKLSKDTKLCYWNTLAGVELPKDEDRDYKKIIEELGFYG